MPALSAALRNDAWPATESVDHATRSVVRASTPHDAPAIGAFLNEAFKGNPTHPPYDARQFHWKYWQPRAGCPGARSFVMMQGDSIVAHAGVMPGRLTWRGGSLQTLHVIDWAARPEAAGAGSALMKHVGSRADALLAIGGSARTLALLPALRFQPAGGATRFMRSLRPSLLLKNAPRVDWRGVMRSARGVVWRLGTNHRHEGVWQVRRVMPADIARAGLPLDHDRPAAAGERSAEMLGYMLSCPATPMALYRVNKIGTSIRGYFLLGFAPRQARLADCRVESEDPADWHSLIQLAVTAALENPGIAEITALSSDDLLSASLARAGFHARPKQPIQLFIKPGLASPAGPVHVQLIDNDLAWRHGGR